MIDVRSVRSTLSFRRICCTTVRHLLRTGKRLTLTGMHYGHKGNTLIDALMVLLFLHMKASDNVQQSRIQTAEYSSSLGGQYA